MAPTTIFHADPEEMAEAYIMDRMTPADKTAYILHLEACPSCAAAVEEQRVFIEAMRSALREFAARSIQKRASQK